MIRKGVGEKFAPGRPKKVIIVGAGMAGLVAGYELKRAGHEPLILEASSGWAAGSTPCRQPFTDGLYAEVGAMRIPRAHELTLEYICQVRASDQ